MIADLDGGTRAEGGRGFMLIGAPIGDGWGFSSLDCYTHGQIVDVGSSLEPRSGPWQHLYWRSWGSKRVSHNAFWTILEQLVADIDDGTYSLDLYVGGDGKAMLS